MARLDRSLEGPGKGEDRLHTPTAEAASLLRPSVSPDLLAYLEAIFPDKLPPQGSPYTELERAWGRREVIEQLRRAKELNEEEQARDVLQQGSTAPAGADARTATRSPG